MRRICFFGLSLITCSFAHSDPAPAPAHSDRNTTQVVVIDAGSAGTRVHIFNMKQVPSMVKGDVPEVDLSVRAQQTLKVRPGLSTFAEQADYKGAGLTIETLIAFANEFVPEERRAATPVLLKATAGLRALPAAQAIAVMGQVRVVLMQSPYRVRPEWASIIEGKEEGGLAWVAANYLQGTFKAHQTGDDALKPSIGVLEMGGGSTQVAFEVPQDEDIDAKDTFVFQTAHDKQYRVYSHSYLGFGLDYAQRRLMSMTSASALQDPCYPDGYMRIESSTSSSLVNGTGDFQQCKADIGAQLLNSPDAPGNHSHRELPLRGAFAASVNFYWVQHGASQRWEERDQVDAADFQRAGEQFCSQAMQPTAQERSRMESGQADPMQPNSCFGLAHQAAFLNALNTSNASEFTMRVARQINGSDLDWALGAAIVEHMREDEHTTHKDSIFASPFLWLMMVPAVAALVLIYRAIWLVRKTPRNQARVPELDASCTPQRSSPTSTARTAREEEGEEENIVSV